MRFLWPFVCEAIEFGAPAFISDQSQKAPARTLHHWSVQNWKANPPKQYTVRTPKQKTKTKTSRKDAKTYLKCKLYIIIRTRTPHGQLINWTCTKYKTCHFCGTVKEPPAKASTHFQHDAHVVKRKKTCFNIEGVSVTRTKNIWAARMDVPGTKAKMSKFAFRFCGSTYCTFYPLYSHIVWSRGTSTPYRKHLHNNK